MVFSESAGDNDLSSGFFLVQPLTTNNRDSTNDRNGMDVGILLQPPGVIRFRALIAATLSKMFLE
jgi:hypothetical protein